MAGDADDKGLAAERRRLQLESEVYLALTRAGDPEVALQVLAGIIADTISLYTLARGGGAWNVEARVERFTAAVTANLQALEHPPEPIL